MENSAVTVQVYNRDHDATRNRTDHLIQTTNEWIAFRTWRKAPSETGITVKDHGETLHLEPVELDQNIIADHIRSEALDAINAHDQDGHPVPTFNALVRNSDEVAEELIAHWQHRLDYILNEQIREGLAGWTGSIAWTAHDDEAISIEADRVMEWFIDEHGGSGGTQPVKSEIQQILKQALDDAVAAHRDYRTPHLEYAAEVTLTD